MRQTMIAVGGVMLAVVLTGCATSPLEDKPQAIGKSISFTTQEPAPAEFDSWTFFWTCPSVERFDADLQYHVLMPDGSAPYVYDCDVVTAGGGVRSDFWPTMFKELGKPDRDLVAPFHGKSITIVFCATKGRIRFAHPEGFSFAFYKKGEDGKTDYSKAIKQTHAVMTLGRTTPPTVQ